MTNDEWENTTKVVGAKPLLAIYLRISDANRDASQSSRKTMKPQDPHSRRALAAGAAAFLAAFHGLACVTAAPPIDPSELVAPRVVLVDGDVEFTIEPTVSGRRYQLQQSATLEGGSWVGLVHAAPSTVPGSSLPRRTRADDEPAATVSRQSIPNHLHW